jgi:hypothetical protein
MLYILPFDHRGSFQTKLFGWKPPVRHPAVPPVRRAAPEDRRPGGAGRLKAKPARIFRFEEIREAHRVMEANEARGKMVVVVHD